jgi:diguanylate cyclase (GGDEF)-like protein/PAS domain S-box-containing protein
MQLAKFICENLDPIMREWEKFAKTVIPGGQDIDPALLRDDVKKMLLTIAADLARPQTAFAQAEKSKGHRPVLKSPAATHGAEREAAGFSLSATVAEYRAMRATVIRLWQEAHGDKPPPKTVVEDLIRFNEAIDQAVSESVVSYSFEKDQQFRQFDTILSSTPDLGFTFDLKGRFTYANKALRHLLDLPLDKIVGKSGADLAMQSVAELYWKMKKVVRTDKPFQGEISSTNHPGQTRWYEYILAPVHNKMGKVEAVAGTARDVTERRNAGIANWENAHYDMLTGLPNRRLFSDRLAEYVKHAKRLGTALALLFIDLDHFKEANDKFGHDAGDLLLRLTAERIRACVRETDIVARLGGDEFMVVLQDLHGPGVELVAEKIRKQLTDPIRHGDHTVQVSASIGIAAFPEDADTADRLIKCADQAMFTSKAAGGNRFSFFSPNLAHSIEARRQLIADLRVAIPQHQLSLVYQPIFDMTDGRIIKAEALLRWNHPDRGQLFPGEFIGPAEDAKLTDEMNAIGNWVFTEAALHSREWSAKLRMPFQISINLSAGQFTAHPNLLNWGAYLKKLDLAPRSIAVDIKEGVLMNGPTDVSDRVTELHDAGIELAVDDFGNNSASIARFKKMAVDTIKLDSSLVREMTADAGGQMITKASIAMAHTLGMKVIAEGVETMEQRDWLQSAGCDYAQGNFFAAPVRTEELEKLLQRA